MGDFFAMTIIQLANKSYLKIYCICILLISRIKILYIYQYKLLFQIIWKIVLIPIIFMCFSLFKIRSCCDDIIFEKQQKEKCLNIIMNDTLNI